eukprot:10516382-Prorocentrum_lima.AAC.1
MDSFVQSASTLRAAPAAPPPELNMSKMEPAPETDVSDRPALAAVPVPVPVPAADDCSVRVAVRLRPLSSEERFAH